MVNFGAELLEYVGSVYRAKLIVHSGTDWDIITTYGSKRGMYVARKYESFQYDTSKEINLLHVIFCTRVFFYHSLIIIFIQVMW